MGPLTLVWPSLQAFHDQEIAVVTLPKIASTRFVIVFAFWELDTVTYDVKHR